LSEKEYAIQVDKLTQLNHETDKRYYDIEKSKQELIKMQDHDYEVMKNKNIKLRNELSTLNKYFKAKVNECEEMDRANQ